MREIRLFGSEGEGAETNRFSLPLTMTMTVDPGVIQRFNGVSLIFLK